VLVEDGRIVGRFQSLMNSGAWVPPFIEQLTGISNAMLADAPPARAVMHEVMRFTRGCPLVAHNAAFDRGFWRAEADWPAASRPGTRLCLHGAAVAPAVPAGPQPPAGHAGRLHDLPDNGRAHRALADATTTAQLLLQVQADLAQRFALELAGRPVSHALLRAVQRVPRTQLAPCVARWCSEPAAAAS
jgi:DNA polymerase-3 subunit epsilon